MLDQALKIMIDAHYGQFDRGGKPYALHPLAVMSLLDDSVKNNETIQVIALLHDVVEDSDVTYSDLRTAGISERAIEGIRCLTKVPGQTLEEYKSAVMSNRDAMFVKMADLTHNSDVRRLKGVSDKDLERMAKYQKFYWEIQNELRKVLD